MAKIYLASRYSRRREMIALAELLKQAGHEITTRWLATDWPDQPEGSSVAPPEYRTEWALKNVEDVLASDWVVSFTEKTDSPGRGGRHVEYGIAIGAGKRLIVVGHRENLFHELPGVVFYDIIDYFLFDAITKRI